MKVYLEKAIFYNRVPFDKLELNFHENEIAVLSSVNGTGKTTILSHIADAFYEMTRKYFRNEYENKQDKLYRLSGEMYSLNPKIPSIVYLRFNANNENFDYIDIRGTITEVQYNEIINIEGKIVFSQIQQVLINQSYTKMVSTNFTKEKAEMLFANNIMTYFPAYRYEQPGYLNDPYKINIKFSDSSIFSGYLLNPIEVISDLPQLANWIMDVVLDNQYLNVKIEDIENVLHNIEIDELKKDQLPSLINNVIQIIIQKKSEIQRNLNLILTNTLISKNYGVLRFGIGPRGFGITRVQIINVNSGNQVYPSIFNISSGEAAVLCLFGEILRQADKIKTNINLSEITGIVLVDEIDKHLHIKLQKEVLPKLIALFPNMQFIVSSHSPFLSMGLAEDAQERSIIIDLDNLGISKNPTFNKLFTEVYEMMVNENERFKGLYESLEQKIKEGTKPLIITEGKTDVQHIKNAKEKLNIDYCDIEFYNVDGNWGATELKPLLEHLSKIPQARKVIGIFDRDLPNILFDIEGNGQPYKKYGNNVYSFCIPIPPGREAYSNISIEFYYTDEEIKKENNGERLYFDNEVEVLYNKTSKKSEIRKLDSPDSKRENVKKVFCEDIGSEYGIHSKARFAEIIEVDDNFTSDFNFSNFKLIFDKISEIIADV